MTITYVRLPVHFLGEDTGLTAESKRHASIVVHSWLIRTPRIRRPDIPAEFLARGDTVPTQGRLYDNTTIENGVFKVGLGSPDGRKSAIRAAKESKQRSLAKQRAMRESDVRGA